LGALFAGNVDADGQGGLVGKLSLPGRHLLARRP
jgi:hypothetical protein